MVQRGSGFFTASAHVATAKRVRESLAKRCFVNHDSCSDLVATVAEEDRVVSQTLERTHVAITMKIVDQKKLRSWR